MTTSVPATRHSTDQGSQLANWLIDWIKGHRQAATYLAAALVVGAGLLWWNVLSTRRSEAIAGQQLSQARLAFESRNLPLAASELARLVENYAGTNAAQEGALILAQVRMLQGQGQQAIEHLSSFAPGADRPYRAQAYGLLGAAYENIGRPREAAESYEKASEYAQFPFLEAQYLSDAGRAWVAAGDTAKAVASYRKIVAELQETGTVTEAKVRLGELTRGSGAH